MPKMTNANIPDEANGGRSPAVVKKNSRKPAVVKKKNSRSPAIKKKK